MANSATLEGFFAIPVSHLETATIVAFDLYLPRHDGTAVLYRERNLVFTSENKQRLEQNGVRELFVPQDQFDAYRSYRLAQSGELGPASAPRVEISPEEEDLAGSLQDRSLPIEARASLLLGVSYQVVEAALSDLGSPGLPQRVFRLADNTARFLASEPPAYFRLVSMLQSDFDAYSHAINTALYSIQLAAHASIEDPHEIALIGRAALVHDVGRGDLPGELLHQSTGLSDLEWAEVMSHVDRGLAQLREAGWDDATCLDVVAHHHERADGKGYPQGLKLEKISRAARIVSIADCFDALTSSHGGRQASTGFQALWTMKRDLAGQFDPDLLDRFIAAMVENQRL
jgi:HD-GYP domain-containing protein (c-di-GMP phosphodiesterase class II)